MEACHFETGNAGPDPADPDRGSSDAGVANAAQTMKFRCASQLAFTIFSIRGRVGRLYYSLDGGQCGSIQMRVIHDLTLHSLLRPSGTPGGSEAQKLDRTPTRRVR